MEPITQNLAVAYNSNVCVKYIPFGVSEEKLKKVFNFSAENNIILSVKLTTKSSIYDDKPTQFAYILYDTVANA